MVVMVVMGGDVSRLSRGELSGDGEDEVEEWAANITTHHRITTTDDRGNA
jgi:hypothetical protein